MTLFARDKFEAFVKALPGTGIVHQWGDASVGKVGGKIFALQVNISADGVRAISFKASDMAYEMLPTLKGARPAPYLARAKWIQVDEDCDLGADELAAYLTQAHRLVAAKLPAPVKAELGLNG